MLAQGLREGGQGYAPLLSDSGGISCGFHFASRMM